MSLASRIPAGKLALQIFLGNKMIHHLTILTPAFSIVALGFFSTIMLAEIAVAATAKMLNKTVRYSFNGSAHAKREDGTTVLASGNFSRTLYISGQGRIFDREDRQEYREKKTSDRGPEGTKFRIEGNRIVGLFQHVSGATRIIISFSDDLKTCTLNAMSGAEAGKSVQFKGLNGITYTMLSKSTYSNLTCSVTDGNAFGG